VAIPEAVTGDEMRIVKPIEECWNLAGHAGWLTKNTIEISDAEWDEIVSAWIKYATSMPKDFKPFSQYLRELIELTGVK
jgi:hypothetical protein